MINQDYQYTKDYMSINEVSLIDNSIYFFSYSAEERSHIIDVLKVKYNNILFIEIKTDEMIKDVITDTLSNIRYSLRSENEMQSFIGNYNSSAIYIDTTGLNNRIAASLLRNAVLLSKKRDLQIRIIYTEPHSYKIPQFKLEGVYNDLSEKIEGIEPLPGFANLFPNTNEVKFVALLGFEGGRFTYIKESISPPDDSIIPVVGVPGFRPEYPFVALWGNRITLDKTGAWNDLRYVAANSLVDIYFLLKKILTELPENYKLIVAPIGTKPHAIGAMLFALQFPNQVEIVYDNPKRKINRTDGIGKIVVCDISSLIRDN